MELAVMFIRNCPNKDLSLVFMGKPQREWTASEVQERLDEFLREHRVSGVQDRVELKGMLDTGSMATTLSADAVPCLREAGVVAGEFLSPADVVLVGCGGKQTSPLGQCDLKLEVYGMQFEVPVLVVEGQIDQLIIGTNVLKPLINRFKSNDGYWRVVGQPDGECQEDSSQFIHLLSNLERWRGDSVPDKVGTLKLKSAVTLLPMTEHLVWGRLPPKCRISAGSTVLVEPSTSRCVGRNILVGRVVTPLWGDGWLPIKIINPTTAEVTLRRNAKVADVYPCIALEDFDDNTDPDRTVYQNVGGYIPGPKNVVADALSREPFVNSRILHRLTRTSYAALLEEAEGLRVDAVQDMFHISTELSEMREKCAVLMPGEPVVSSCLEDGGERGKISCDEVSAVLRSHRRWDEGATVRAISHVQQLKCLTSMGQSPLPVLSREELHEKQCQDPIVSRVKFFVDRGRRPSRRERVHESRETLRTLRQWGKLTTRLGVVYRVSKNPTTKRQTFQYVVPEALRSTVLRGVHDEAGHQGQQRTLWLARQRFYWDTLESDVKQYVQHCKSAGLSDGSSVNSGLEDVTDARTVQWITDLPNSSDVPLMCDGDDATLSDVGETQLPAGSLVPNGDVEPCHRDAANDWSSVRDQTVATQEEDAEVHEMSTKKHKAMRDGEWMARLKKFATTGVWPSEAGNRPAPRQKRWHDLYQRKLKREKENPGRTYTHWSRHTGAEAAVWWATAYKWSTSGSLCLSACCCSGPGTSRPPPPATPPGAMGDGAAEPAPSPRRSPLTLSKFSKPRFGGASGAAAKLNLVARKKPVEPHYGLCEDPASLQPHYGLCEDPASLQPHYGLCEDPASLQPHYGLCEDPASLQPHYGLCEDPASLQPHYGLCEDPASLQPHYGLCEDPASLQPHYGLWEDPASLQPHYGLWEDPAFLQSHYGLCENHSTATEVPRTDLY
ncbi:hypothetical protein SKAU_G00244000 [Synaphobranchus kaupii]|uniref:Gypsy retrotransposon integrase-like protein 1 n=1 Tax=Synaphobranchus kaupii TaxID=118154 RepID=A0A9Q1F1U3_SYNKA|nr:hypothetical protein SKAU_G00244000 [Synaphobranchus kaupii]